MIKEVQCECGFYARGTEEDLVPVVQAHGKAKHGMDVTPEQVIAQLKPFEPDRAVGVDVITQVEIEQTRGDVASFASDPTNATKWYRNIDAVTWETSPPLAVGSRVRFRARFLGRTLEYTYEVVELVPAQRLVMSMASGNFAMETSYDWEDTARGTRMTLRNRGEPQGYLRMLQGVVTAAMRRANRADLARLKALLEAI